MSCKDAMMNTKALLFHAQWTTKLSSWVLALSLLFWVGGFLGFGVTRLSSRLSPIETPTSANGSSSQILSDNILSIKGDWKSWRSEPMTRNNGSETWNDNSPGASAKVEASP